LAGRRCQRLFAGFVSIASAGGTGRLFAARRTAKRRNSATGRDPSAMRAILDVILVALDLYVWIVIASAIVSWLVAFNVINVRNDFVRAIWNFLYQITEPALRPIRNLLPNLGGIDVAPIILLLGIFFIQRVITLYIYPAVF
jgi:YggT family protein